ncbi:methyltransferase family protein [Bacillus oleivorans]|uniref:Methyltransferase family protein n=1 Tax=Bacillus oleivorans TaxID=1448271 RepID=A0A285D8F5_9BACI|nr:class I SAM-dependent methyltransferase [Bacillus oleivorans]SNX75473.1 methyltransferase family protein [Bacillus oleivorans]
MNHYEEQLEESWEVNSKAWTESIREEKIKSRKTVTNPAIIQAILAQDPQAVLDIGCGEGWLARELARKDIRVVGIDGSEPLIDAARKLGSGEFFWLNYGQFSDDPTKVGSNFDVVVFNFSLLSEQIQSVLEASKLVLKKSGKIIIQTLHPISVIHNEMDRYENGWRIENFDGMGEGYQASMPWYFRTLASWVRDLHEAGLQLADCQEPFDPIDGKPLSLILVVTTK